MKLSEMLRKIKENPEDLSTLVDAIAQAENLEENDTKQIEQIGKLQENYRKVLQMVPVPGDEKEDEEKPPAPPTIDDAVEEIRNQLKGES